MSVEAVIRVSGLYKQYQTAAGVVPVLKDVNLTVAPGEFVAIMGPSGSGKSTFMNILGCLDAPSRGRYVLNGKEVETLGPDELARLRNGTIGFVFQGYNLLPRANLENNVGLPLVYAGTSGAERIQRAAQLLAAKGKPDLGRSLLAGDDPVLSAFREGLGNGVEPRLAFGASRLFDRLASDLSHGDSSPLTVVLARSALRLDPRDDHRPLVVLGEEHAAAADVVERVGPFVRPRLGLLDARRHLPLELLPEPAQRRLVGLGRTADRHGSNEPVRR